LSLPNARVAQRRSLQRECISHLLEAALEPLGALVGAQTIERREGAPDPDAGDEDCGECNKRPYSRPVVSNQGLLS
jgi:hypothetical protein